MNIIIGIIVGGIAGWLAGQIMGSRFSVLGNIIIGVVGGFVGSTVLRFVGIYSYGTIGNIIVAVIGALLIGLNSIAGMSGDITGDLLALAGAVLMAGHWLCNRYARRTVEALPFMLLLYTQTALLLALTLPFLGGFQMTPKALLAVAGLALGCTLLGHSMFTLALGKVSATVVSFALLGEPVGAMLWSMVMFGEIPTPLLFVGGSVTIVGLVLYLMGSMGMLSKKH